MANEVGRYTGETVIGTIGSPVGIGQLVYSRSLQTPFPGVEKKGFWFPVGCDTLNTIYIQPGDQPKWASSNQIGVVVRVDPYLPISSTFSGTKATILLKGYFAPGRMSYPGSPTPDTGYYYTSPGANCGGPLYIMPEILTMAGTGATKSSIGAFSNFLPTSTSIGYGNAGATQGSARIIGYAYDLEEPYVVRFDPDNTWIEFGN